MVTIDLTKPGYAEAFADCEVGETKDLTITVTKKTDTEIVGELDTYVHEGDEAEPAAEKESAPAPAYGKSKTPRGVMIAVSGMK